MRPVRGLSLWLPIGRALSQLDDPGLRSIFLQSFAWSLGCFAGLYASSVWIVHRVLELHGWLAWAADAFGSILASLLALWLFLPVAAAIGTMYLERIAGCVERRFYPWLPPPSAGATLLEQVWDSTALALKLLALNFIALIIAFLLPGIGLFLGWIISAYGIGRGLFVTIAMRRMSRKTAELIYCRSRVIVISQGMLLAAATYVPVLNLLIPVVSVVVMVHTLELALDTVDGQRSE